MSKSLITLLYYCASGLAIGGDKKIMRPEGTKPGGSWSHGVLVDGTLYVRVWAARMRRERFQATSNPK